MSTKYHIPPLPKLLETMYQQARHRRGQDISLTLSKGARLAVRATDTEIALTMARPNRPVGDREEQTFKLAGQVPPGARRIPKEGQATREVDGKLYYLVGYVWEEDAGTAQSQPRTTARGGRP